MTLARRTPLADPTHAAWMAEVARHADWIARARRQLDTLAGDAAGAEVALERWTGRGRAELGADINMLSLLSCVRLPPAPDGTAADARLRRRKALSEAAFGAVLRARDWQDHVVYLCPEADGMLLVRLHCRTLALLEHDGWMHPPLDTAKLVVAELIGAHGLEPDLSLPVPRMEDVQRRAYRRLSRELDSFLGAPSRD